MTAFNRAWGFVKEQPKIISPPTLNPPTTQNDPNEQRCKHTRRVITTDGSYMARCTRKKDHPAFKEGLNRFQILSGGHVYPNSPEDGLMFSNEDVIPRWPQSPIPESELEGLE